MDIRAKVGMKRQRFIKIGIFPLAVLAIVVVLFLLPGRPGMKSDVKSQFDTAEAAYKSGNFPDAEAAYLKAKELEPKNAQILSCLGDLSLLNNRSGEAIRYYNDALDNTPWYLNIWPLNVQLKKQLGMAYYRQDLFAEASRYFREAAGPINAGPFKILRSLSEYTGIFASNATYMIEGPEQTKVDFVITDPLPVIKVSVNGGEPQNFFLDTGGAEGVLTKKYADQLNVTTVASIKGSFAGGKTAEMRLGKIESLGLAEFSVKNVPITVLDISENITNYKNLDIKGIIGTRLLMHFLSTIDYVNGTLILQRVTPENLQNLDANIATGSVKVNPFWLADMHVMLAQGRINNQPPTLLFVDTGSADNGFISEIPLLEAAGINVDRSNPITGTGGGGTTISYKITLDRLTLGTGANEIVKNDFPGLVEEGNSAYVGDDLGFHVGGLISHAFFRQNALTFDFTNMRMIIK